ncbi:MAG: hypothetical protein KJ623_00560 [Nanoarchaeota archaeon]|nr:hypothetical protein [Nanoarchaeota archaeon]MBU0963297.1 hypothetical protein [Nanoarchaeota archaeon]
MKKEWSKILLASLLLFILNAFSQPTITGFTIKDTGISVAKTVFSYFKDQVFPRLIEMFRSPFDYPETLWLIIPLFVTILFMQLYFGRWKNEKLGWNSVLANMIALLFVIMNLIYYMIQNYKPEEIFNLGDPVYKIILIGVIIIQIILMMVFVYFHEIPKKILFFIGSSLTINTLAFVTIVMVYGRIPFDLVTLTAFICLYIFVQLFFLLFRWIIPPSKQIKPYLREKAKKENGVKIEKKRVNTLKRHILINHIREKYLDIKNKIRDIFRR